MITFFNDYMSSNIEGLCAFSSCLGLSLVPVFVFIYTTVIIKRYYHEIQKEKQYTLQASNLVRIQRSFSLVPSIQHDNVNIQEKKYNIIVKQNPNRISETRKFRPARV